MTTEIRTIQIEAYRDPEGRPTCDPKTGRSCPMLVNFVVMYCQACEDEPEFDGYFRPVEGCPVWAEK